MSEISNKKKKFIKRNFKQLSIKELALKTSLKPNVIRSLINEYNVEVLERDQCLSKKLMSNNSSLNKRSVCLIGMLAIVIFLLTLVVFAPALKNDFVNWDDAKYVYKNTNIQSLNFKTFYWMLTSFHASNWHPLTWLSHAIDYTLWGFNPLGHHLTSIILHGLNALLVFLLVMRLTLIVEEVNGMTSTSGISLSILTKSLIVAGVTALLFGIHPLHVESVAWIAERKDILCGFFFLLSILAYLSYVSSVLKRHRWIFFTISLALFIFALMSKPMAVTLPLILLLLDLYPLRRLKPHLHKKLFVLLEKIPFFILSTASAVITIIAQHSGGALKSFEHLPLGLRLLNALNSLIFYLKKIIWPFELVPIYPFPKYISVLDPHYLISGILVLAVSVFCLLKLRQGEYSFFTMWSYYLITLLPVIGIIQVGSQAAADRYVYLPSISIFLLVGVSVVWGWEKVSLTRLKTTFRSVLLVCLSAVAFFLSYLTIGQIKVWHNSEVLWNYVIYFSPNRIPDVHNNLGIAYESKGKFDEAISEYKKAMAINHRYLNAHKNLGAIYIKKGMVDEAISEYMNALQIDPNDADAHNNLGTAYVKKGMVDEAISQYMQALVINPKKANLHYNLGFAYGEKGMVDEAISEYKKVLTFKPNHLEAHNNLAIAYYLKGDYGLAIIHCNKIVKLGGSVRKKLLELLKPYR